MRSSIIRRCGQASVGRALTADLVVLAALFAAAVLLGIAIHGRHAVAHEAVAVLALAAGLAAAILLAAVAGLTGSGRTGRVAGAVALYACVALPVRAAGLEEPMNLWVLASSAGVLGALGMLVLGVRGPFAGTAGRWGPGVVGGLTVAVVAVIGGVAFVLPGWLPPAWSVATLDVVAWSGAGAAGIVALIAGARSGRALVRRTGIAFTTLSAAHAVRIVTGGQPGDDRGAVEAALELTAVAMLLVAAVAFFVAVLRGLRVPPPATRPTPATPRARTTELPDEQVAPAGAGMHGTVTVGPVTDGIRILTAAPQSAQPRDPAAGQSRGAGTRRTGSRRMRPGRGRPPGRRGRD